MDYRNIRRVVTGHDAAGKSVILRDEIVKALYERPDSPGRGMADVWKGEAVPATIHDNDDLTLTDPVRLVPPGRGFVVRVVQIPPESKVHGGGANKGYFEGMGAGADIHQEKGRHPSMHKTPTLDVGIVLEGEIWALMEDSEVLLRQGDFLVQRATLHGWSNRSDKPCLLAGVLFAAEGE